MFQGAMPSYGLEIKRPTLCVLDGTDKQFAAQKLHYTPVQPARSLVHTPTSVYQKDTLITAVCHAVCLKVSPNLCQK